MCREAKNRSTKKDKSLHRMEGDKQSKVKTVAPFVSDIFKLKDKHTVSVGQETRESKVTQLDTMLINNKHMLRAATSRCTTLLRSRNARAEQIC